MAEASTTGGGNGLTLSIKLEELQALIDEVRQLRQENVQMYNELTKQHIALNNSLNVIINNVIGNDFSNCVVRATHDSSADFVVKNMPATARMFPNQIENLRYALERLELDGLFLEFGVYKGTTINFISSTKPDKIVYGFDSFEGLPEDWTNNMPKGMFNTGGNFPKVNGNVRLIKGWFNDTLPDFVKEHSEICAFIHVDSDLYSSAKTIFSSLKNQIVAGTVIVFDEYFNYPGWEKGEHQAFVEFLNETGLSCEYLSYSEMQVAVKIK